MIHNLKIRQKLFLIILIPFIGLIIFSAFSINTKNENIKELKLFEQYLKFSKKANFLITQLQKERGFSVGYIVSKKKKFSLDIKTQRKVTNKAYIDLKNFSKKNRLFWNQYISRLISFSTLNDIRGKIDILDISSDQTISFYSKFIQFLINSISNISAISKDYEISTQAEAFINIIKAQEYAGLERGIGNQIFINQEFSAKTFMKLKTYNNNFRAEIISFKYKVNQNTKAYFNKIFNAEEIYDFIQVQNLIYNKIYKNELLSKMKEILGYGGMIHNFKNYILRRKDKYKQRFLSNYESIVTLIEEYEDYDLTLKEEELIEQISYIVDKYKNKLSIIDKYKSKNNYDVIALDKEIIIDDTPAIEALNILSSHIIGVNAENWFKLSSNRIMLLKKVEQNLVKVLHSKKNNLENKLQNELQNQIILIVLLMFIAIVLALSIIKDILEKLKKLEIGLVSFLQYVSRKNNKFELIDLQGDDELAKMSKVLNNSMEETSNYIEYEIKEAHKKEKQIQESIKMMQMGEMIGNIAHQWRQPLSAISSMSSSMIVSKELNMVDEKMNDEYLNKIIDNTNYLSDTINIFRNFVKDDKEMKMVVIQNLLKNTINLIEYNFKSYSIEIQKDLNLDQEIKANIVEGELTQVIINILNNAKDALVEKNIENPWIKIECKYDKKMIFISIEDNAQGIKDDILPKVFDPYFTTKHQSQGTGLGLSMSYDIITKSLFGKLSVTNTKNGAKFTIEIPQNF